jgi:hypothetical protein
VKKYTEEFLLDELRRFYRENGRVPKQRDFCSKNGYVSSRTYCEYFGSWNAALEKSRLQLNRFVGYTDEFLIAELHRFVKENHRNPIHDDFMNNPEYPSAPTYVVHFGSWNASLERAGLNLNRCYNRDPDFLISELYRFIEENGRSPCCRDMNNENGYPCVNLYVDVFGGWNESLQKAGIDVYTGKIYTKDVLISELLRFVDEFDRVPTTRDIDNTSGYPSTRSYKNWFGTYNNALESAGLDIYTCHDFDEESLLEDLRNFADEHGRSPYNTEFTRKNGYFSSGVYIRIWGDWNSALNTAGLEINKTGAYDYSNLICVECNNKIYTDAHTNNQGQIVCKTCRLRQWRKDNPEKYHANRSNPINNKFDSADAHHLHLENNSDFVIYIPTFLHQLHGHQKSYPGTLDTMNSIAFDFLIQEDFYIQLYLTGEAENG